MKNEYGEYLTSRKTAQLIADFLSSDGRVLFAWTDDVATHYDILIVTYPYQLSGSLHQGGIKKNDLFVSIMRKGAFSFKISENHDIQAEYLNEKLGIFGEASKTLATLLNWIIEEFIKYEEKYA